MRIERYKGKEVFKDIMEKGGHKDIKRKGDIKGKGGYKDIQERKDINI